MRLAADRLAVDVLRADVTKVETAQVVRAAEEEPIENRHTIAVAPGIDAGDLRVEQQDQIVPEVEILRRLQIEAVDLRVAAEESAGDIGRERRRAAPAGSGMDCRACRRTKCRS